MNRKGSMASWIIVGFLVVIIIVAVTFFLITKQKLDKDPIQSDYKDKADVKLYLQSVDSSSNPIDSEYALYYENIFLSKGKLVADWNEFQTKEGIIKVYCWADGYYLSEAYKEFSQEEITNGKAKMSCNLEKIGDIRVTSSGTLSNNGNIVLNVSSDNKINKLSISTTKTSKTGTLYCFYIENKLISLSNSSKSYFYNPELKQPQSSYKFCHLFHRTRVDALPYLTSTRISSAFNSGFGINTHIDERRYNNNGNTNKLAE